MKQESQEAWVRFVQSPQGDHFRLLHELTRGFVASICVRLRLSEDDIEDTQQLVFSQILELAQDQAAALALPDINEHIAKLTQTVGGTLK
ncbi:MAG: hypothetical protein K1X53_01140, partial [Candidatus Sumerlaeaceae bacterium]|nr:hypothetical protein [Candidatus Sumerlaeaceae bacterium]